MPRFVVLEHDHPELHWDFMLEHAGALKTWRLTEFPPPLGQKLRAQALADHRLLYLNYEGPVSGNRGQVIRREQGTYDIVPPSDESAGREFNKDSLLLTISGSRLCGSVCLERLEGNVWHLAFEH
jgi:DNA polymerase Ligase (LigD)